MSVIAIDGPAGAGKSSVAREVARALGAVYVDTGAMYRAVGLAALEAGIEPGDSDAVAALVEDLRLDVSETSIELDGVDVTRRIRSRDVTAAAAVVARHQVVRDALVRLQRELAASRLVVMEGRDIGTEVFPHADVKIYLTASLEERARRRIAQLDLPSDHEAERRIRSDIEQRDLSDSTRSASPLKKADDAVVVDTTHMEANEVVEHIRSITQRVLDGGRRS